MVKGISRRVVVIRPPDTRVFEEAIFIVREDVCNEKSVTGEMIIKEAQEIADRYVRENLKKRRLPKLPPLFFTALGAIITSAVWIATILL
ncbi:MAG: translation initiation factor 2 [Oscillospiraceae bacterium]|nr:translation initiation factor 2 [Oscillospiraceae bacterium]